MDDAGRFTDEAGAEFAGLAVLAEGNQAVIDKLSAVGALLKVCAWHAAVFAVFLSAQPDTAALVPGACLYRAVRMHSKQTR